jgi:site-specific recombinase XerD
MFLLDTGARRAELTDLQLPDLDPDLDVAIVLGKGRRERALPYGRKTATFASGPGTRTPISHGSGLANVVA